MVTSARRCARDAADVRIGTLKSRDCASASPKSNEIALPARVLWRSATGLRGRPVQGQISPAGRHLRPTHKRNRRHLQVTWRVLRSPESLRADTSVMRGRHPDAALLP